MKTNEELKALYENDLKEKLASLEVMRKKVRNKTILMGILLLVTVGSFVMSGEHGFGYLLYLGVAGVIGIVVFIIKFNKEQGLYRREFKEKVVRSIVNLIHADWSYNPDGYTKEPSIQ